MFAVGNQDTGMAKVSGRVLFPIQRFAMCSRGGEREALISTSFKKDTKPIIQP